jgi:predicted component of type VI protein secretion system
MSTSTKLIIASGKSAGKAIAVKNNRLLIGRAEECDIRPLSDEVSRRHCMVQVEPDVVWVEDLGSRNGTFVNGTRITEKIKLFEGDLLAVGGLQLKVSGGSAGQAVKTAAAAPPASWNDEEEVSRWLMAESGQPSGMHDTTQVAAAVPVEAEGAAAHANDSPTIHVPAANADRSSVVRMSIDELKASRTAPGSLPVESKKAGSSREAAAEALKKLFGNR